MVGGISAEGDTVLVMKFIVGWKITTRFRAGCHEIVKPAVSQRFPKAVAAEVTRL
jgi:hypothetical protein